MKHEVFISYSTKDKQMANAVCHYLEQEKIRCWIAPRDVKPGANFAAEIVDAIPQSKIMLLILSKSSNSSKQVLREMEIAVNNDLVVIPLRIEDIVPTGSMSYYLSTTQWIDIIDGEIDSRLNILVDRIAGIVGILKPEDQAQRTQEKVVDRPQSPPATPPVKKKISKKKLIIILVSSFLVIAAGVTVLVLRDEIFAGETKTISESAALGTEEPTTSVSPIQTEVPAAVTPTLTDASTTEVNESLYQPADFGWDATYKVYIPDRNLLVAVINTLRENGEEIENEVAIADMFKLKSIIAGAGWLDESEPEYYFHREILGYISGEYILSISWGTSGVNPGIGDLSGLEYAKNLEYLVLDNCMIKNINFADDLNKLKVVYLSNAPLLSISPLENSKTELKILSLTGCRSLRDFSVLSGFINLEYLGLGNTKFKDVELLEGMENLRVLQLGAEVDDKDIEKLVQLPLKSTLEELYIAEKDYDDISFLLQFDNLQFLYLSLHTYDNNTTTINELKAKGCSIYKGGVLME